MKKIISLLLALLTLLVCFVSCNESSGGSRHMDPLSAQHSELSELITNLNREAPYAEKFTLYNSVIAHIAQHSCSLDIEPLLRKMLLGGWKDAQDNYIEYTYVYEDYSNLVGDYWFSTNLPSSKKTGNTYYYYSNVSGNGLSIGYGDKITKAETENYLIFFVANGINVYCKINNKNYTMQINNSVTKVEKGNAKLAYECIAKKIDLFKNPSSVVVSQCYVDHEEKIVYATIQGTNGFGGTVTNKYKLYELSGYYFIDEIEHGYVNTNIDLEELNKKLMAYVSAS